MGQPVATALRDAGSRLSEGVPPAADENDEENDNEGPPGSLPPPVTGAIVAGLPRAVDMCNVFQQWSTAASEATASQQRHLGLCLEWTSQAARLGDALKQCAQTARSAGLNVVVEARRCLDRSVLSATEDVPLEVRLRDLTKAEELESTVPELELQFLALARMDEAAQREQGPALVSKLQSLLDAGFVEI